MSTELKLRELLLPVFGLDHVDEAPATASLVSDLGADSLDFVEIVYLIEKEFDVQLATKTLFLGGVEVRTEDYFVEGVLVPEKAAELREKIPSEAHRFRDGMTRAELFGLITVGDLARVVELKLAAKA